MLCYVLEEMGAFTYTTLRPHVTELVHVISVEENGDLTCRSESSVNDELQLQQQLHDVYNSGLNHSEH